MTRQATTPQASRLRAAVARGPGIARRALGSVVLIAACWGALLTTTPAPTGDPVLLAMSPAADEIVRSPDEVRITFDRPVPAALATVRMVNPTGEQVVIGRPTNPPGAADTLAVPMPPTRYAGTYSVVWSTPSSRLEPISGTFGFAVSAPTGPVAVLRIAPERDPVVTVVHTVARLVATAASMLGVGMAVVLALAWPGGALAAPARRLIVCAWSVLVVATLVTIVSFGPYAARTPLGDAFDPALLPATAASDIGAGLLAGLVVLVPITVGLVRMLRGAPADTPGLRWSRAGTVLGCAAALMATWAVARPHDPAGPTLLAVVAEVALLLAVAVCVGALVSLWVLLRTGGVAALRSAVPRRAAVATDVRPPSVDAP